MPVEESIPTQGYLRCSAQAGDRRLPYCLFLRRAPARIHGRAWVVRRRSHRWQRRPCLISGDLALNVPRSIGFLVRQRHHRGGFRLIAKGENTGRCESHLCLKRAAKHGTGFKAYFCGDIRLTVNRVVLMKALQPSCSRPGPSPRLSFPSSLQGPWHFPHHLSPQRLHTHSRRC